MRLPAYLTVLAAAAVLAACDSIEEEAVTAETPLAADDMAMSGDMPMEPEAMPMGQANNAAQVASAEGTITAIDEEAGTITIDHGPVAAIGWPAMTMGFTADAPLRQQVAVGDEVAFDFRASDAGNELTSIRRK